MNNLNQQSDKILNSDLPKAVLLPVTVAEAKKKFPMLKTAINSYGDKTDYVIVCEGDSFFPGDLNIDFHLDDWFNPNDGDGATGIIFNGNLTVEGSVTNMEGDYGPFLLVLGDLKAKNIDKGGSEFYITGDCEVTNAIYGYYNHGTLNVGGEIKAAFLVNYDHFIEGAVHKDTIKVNNHNDYGDYDYYAEDIPNVFLSEVLDRDGERIESSTFIQYLNEGKSVLKAGAKPSRVILEEYIQQLAESGEEITKLDLNDKKLKQFPSAILSMKSLKVLDLSDNPIEKIPEDIYKLENLEELYLCECMLEELPKEIGKLTKLQVLDISRNNPTDSGLQLPNTVENLVNLKVLKINYNKDFKLPLELTKIQLEELEAKSCNNDKPIKFPEIICKLTSLKRLNLSGNSFKQIPDSFLNLVNLEQLNLDSTIQHFKTLLDLSRLPKLKILSADGSVSPYYKTQSFLKDFFKISTLEELNIDRHGIEAEYYYEDYDPEKLTRIKKALVDDPKAFEKIKESLTVESNGRTKLIMRDRLKPEHLQGIGQLKHLKVLDLSFNGLEELPEDFWELKELQSINLEYNSLPQELRERIAKAFPKTKIDFRNQRGTKSEIEEPEDEAFQEMKQLVGKGNDNRNPSGYKEAITYYDQALEFFKNGKVTDEYNLIYIHYSKMWVYAHMFSELEESIEEIAQYKKLCFDEAQICLELVPTNMNVWHFTDEGEFHREVIRYACNSIAWYLYENYDEQEKLEEALRIIERGLEFVDKPEYYYIRDTKVRILLKLNRKDEAYALVQKTLNYDPYFEDFEDLKNDQEYLDWVLHKEKFD